MGRSHEELKDLIAPYALGAVPADEMVEIRAHILECEECMTEADKFTDAAASLAYAAPPEAPPHGFADRVIDLVHEEHGDRASAAAGSTSGRHRWRWIEALSFAALLILTGVLSLSLIDARRDANYDRDVVAALLNNDEGLKLQGAGGRGTILSSDGDALFVAQGLDDVASDHTYQLWLMQGDCATQSNADLCHVVSAGTFESRHGVAILKTSEPLSGYADAAVTIEPEGGSDAPTTTPVITSF